MDKERIYISIGYFTETLDYNNKLFLKLSMEKTAPG
jgi:hypothetical protein